MNEYINTCNIEVQLNYNKQLHSYIQVIFSPQNRLMMHLSRLSLKCVVLNAHSIYKT